jgi:MFS family permease
MLSSLPNFIALFFLYIWSKHSDKHGERFWHIVAPKLLASVGLTLCAICIYFNSLWWFVISTIVFTIGFWSGESVFLTYPHPLYFAHY